MKIHGELRKEQDFALLNEDGEVEAIIRWRGRHVPTTAGHCADFEETPKLMQLWRRSDGPNLLRAIPLGGYTEWMCAGIDAGRIITLNRLWEKNHGYYLLNWGEVQLALAYCGHELTSGPRLPAEGSVVFSLYEVCPWTRSDVKQMLVRHGRRVIRDYDQKVRPPLDGVVITDMHTVTTRQRAEDLRSRRHYKKRSSKRGA